jgi:hypothetical protein
MAARSIPYPYDGRTAANTVSPIAKRRRCICIAVGLKLS